MSEITVGHACPDCGCRYLTSRHKEITCDNCGWAGSFEDLAEVKVSVQ